MAADAPVSLVSVTTPVQDRIDFTIAAVRIHNAGAAVNSVHLHLQFIVDRGKSQPIVWDADRDQGPSCHVSAPNSLDAALDCDYPVSIAAGGNADIPVHAFVTEGDRTETAPAPRVRVFVGDPAAGQSLTTDPIERVKHFADLTVSASSPTGAVGDVVDVHLVMKNNGPAHAWNFSIGLGAPEGAEWVGAGFEECWTPPRTSIVCKPGGFVEPGQTYEHTFQLKITSTIAKPGVVDVLANWSQGADPDPYFHIVDPDTSNNTGEFHVTMGTAPHPSTTSATAGPSAGTSAGAGEPLPVTGSNVTLYITAGVALALAGTVLLILVRRRRVRFTLD
ncbi:LPXTG cell wall anchor domain-containing protein [Dactylosporangium matsuzakiense]|uniref:LPXTG cell wall anchor domain-containing protein n=1 Tax=Dactylosporangium matsuzakiense TaxID=53360 RepID=UPI0022F2C01D|nr:LPXTG cell wall anchor domain-containing protein [Dactylosporangium matsuzakiense]